MQGEECVIVINGSVSIQKKNINKTDTRRYKLKEQACSESRFLEAIDVFS